MPASRSQAKVHLGDRGIWMPLLIGKPVRRGAPSFVRSLLPIALLMLSACASAQHDSSSCAPASRVGLITTLSPAGEDLPGGTLRGTVQDTGTDEAMADVQVAFLPADSTERQVRFSDSEGFLVSTRYQPDYSRSLRRRIRHIRDPAQRESREWSLDSSATSSVSPSQCLRS